MFASSQPHENVLKTDCFLERRKFSEVFKKRFASQCTNLAQLSAQIKIGKQFCPQQKNFRKKMFPIINVLLQYLTIPSDFGLRRGFSG